MLKEQGAIGKDGLTGINNDITTNEFCTMFSRLTSDLQKEIILFLRALRDGEITVEQMPAAHTATTVKH